MKYEEPTMEVMYLDNVRTDTLTGESGGIEPGDGKVDVIYPI